MNEIYDLVTLLIAQTRMQVPQTFFLGRLFPNSLTFETEKIAFDRVNRDYRRAAPYVVPNAQGRVMGRTGYDTLEFKPAYVKPKDVVRPTEVNFVRQAGEAFGAGSMSPAERYQAVIAEYLFRHRNYLTMTNELQAAQAVIDGQILISGEDYPETLVDFRRDPSLTGILTGASQWDTTTAEPLKDLAFYKRRANSLSGAVTRDIVMGHQALEHFLEFQEVRELLDRNLRGTTTEVSLLNDSFEDSAEFIGVVAGSGGNGTMRIWSYSGKYWNENGVYTDVLDPATVIGFDAAAFAGTQCFGLIQDPKAGNRALPFFPKMWEADDPAATFIMTQSAPLMVPGKPNASWKLKVAATQP